MSAARWQAGLLGVPLAFAVLVACNPRSSARAKRSDSALVAQRAARVEQELARPDSGTGKREPIARWVLPGSLGEISGLALTADGRLLTHNDEQARVVELDYRRGTIVKQFSLGSPPARGDFEAIAVAPDADYLLASDGQLYEFQEGADGARVAFTVHDLRLGKECEFEGLAYEPASNSLLLACKNVGKKSLQDYLVIYRWRRGSGGGERLSEFTVPLARIIGTHHWKGFHPTDIAVDPASGNYVLIASPEKAIVELTPAGDLVFARSLPGHHEQPEGVAIGKNGILIISDEAGSRPAAVSVYRWPWRSTAASPDST